MYVERWVFGDALLAMPLLGLVLGPRLATPLVALGSLSIVLLMLRHTRSDVDWPSALRLVAGNTIGTAAGSCAASACNRRAGSWAVLACYWCGTRFGSFSAHGNASCVIRGRFTQRDSLPDCWAVPPMLMVPRWWCGAHYAATTVSAFAPRSKVTFCLLRYLLLCHTAWAVLWSMGLFRYFVFALPCTIAGVWLGGASGHPSYPNSCFVVAFF